MSSRLKDARRQTHWLAWLRRPFALLDSGEYIATHEWAAYMVEEDLVPALNDMGYNLLYTPHQITEKILNRLYNLERNYLKGLPANIYQGQQNRSEDYEHFFTVKCTEGFWNQLAWQNRIEWFADEDQFATRVWIELPGWVAQFIDYNRSDVTAELNAMLGYGPNETAREDEEAAPAIKKETPAVDPYIQDYYTSAK